MPNIVETNDGIFDVVKFCSRFEQMKPSHMKWYNMICCIEDPKPMIMTSIVNPNVPCYFYRICVLPNLGVLSTYNDEMKHACNHYIMIGQNDISKSHAATLPSSIF